MDQQHEWHEGLSEALSPDAAAAAADGDDYNDDDDEHFVTRPLGAALCVPQSHSIPMCKCKQQNR